ncbi:MAG: dienelactone hydrolase, partial [Nevskia sp.]|nr:dienelactone hydrolase [Nevskia sp.]
MATMIKLQSTSTDYFEFAALHAQPTRPRRGGVIVIQEIFGIDAYVQADVERWSQLGFEVLAPSMFDRIAPGFIADHDVAGFGAGAKIVGQIQPEPALADIAACVAFLQG